MATKYLRGAGTGAWNTNASWSTTSSAGAANTTKPVAGDTVILDAGSTVNCNIDTSAQACTVLTCTNYTYQLQFNQNLTVAGNVRLPSGVGGSVSGTATLIMSAASTLYSNGKTISGGLTFSGTNTKTLNGNAIVTGLVTLSGATTLNWTTNETITCNGGITSSAVQVSGTAKIIVGGGTIRSTSASNAFCNNIDFNGVGTITIGATFAFKTKTLTWVAGTIDSTTNSSNLVIAGSSTLNTPTANMSWQSVQITAATTLTLTSSPAMIDLGLSANLTLSGAFDFNVVNIYVLAGGTRTFTMVRDLPSFWNLYLQASLTMSGAYNFNPTNVYTIAAATLTLAKDMVACTDIILGASLTLSGNFTFNTLDLTVTANSTLRVIQPMTISGNLTVNNTRRLTLSSDSAGISVTGILDTNASGNIISTKATITMNAGSTWQSTGWTTGHINADIVFGGDCSIVGSVGYRTKTITYSTGIITTTGSTLNIVGSGAIINTPSANMSWNNLITGAYTITASSTLTFDGDVTISSGGVLACGTNDIVIGGNWINNAGTTGRTGNNLFTFNGEHTYSGNTDFYNLTLAPGSINHLTSGDTFAATGTFNAIGTIGSPITLDSTIPDSQAIFPVTTLGIVSYVTATDIDSSGGVQILNTKGTLDNATNWTLSAIAISSIMFGCNF
jgi:hypothetical protein